MPTFKGIGYCTTMRIFEPQQYMYKHVQSGCTNKIKWNSHRIFCSTNNTWRFTENQKSNASVGIRWSSNSIILKSKENTLTYGIILLYAECRILAILLGRVKVTCSSGGYKLYEKHTVSHISRHASGSRFSVYLSLLLVAYRTLALAAMMREKGWALVAQNCLGFDVNRQRQRHVKKSIPQFS